MSIKSYVGKGKPHYTIINRQDKLNAKLEELAQKDANFQENFKLSSGIFFQLLVTPIYFITCGRF